MDEEGGGRNVGAPKMMYSCKIMLKPLSVNRCWQGRRFKTQDYKGYEKILLEGLPDSYIPDDGEKLMIYLHWGFSSSRSDWDNPIKPFQDVLQKKYSFDDKHVFLGIVEKSLVKKGDEYIYVQIKGIPPTDVVHKFIKELFSHD